MARNGAVTLQANAITRPTCTAGSQVTPAPKGSQVTQVPKGGVRPVTAAPVVERHARPADGALLRVGVGCVTVVGRAGVV